MRRMLGMSLATVLAFGSAVACERAEEPAVTDRPATDAPATTPGAPAGHLPEGITQEMVAQGQQLFTGQGNCFTCHGMDGRGTTLAPDLTDGQWINATTGEFEEVVEVVRTGVAQPRQYPAPMPPMGGASLSDEQVRAVSAYVYSLSHR
jgi:mono/diheme cytochrome c family protein